MNCKIWKAIFACAFALCIVYANSLMAAEGERPNINFNHDQTIFKLTGVHTNTACESCHVKGVFKGTPITCTGCHNRGTTTMAATAKSATHVPTTAECNTCHKTSGWIPATVDHNNPRLAPCSTCHNGTNATGKPPSHLKTTTDCGVCHRTMAWTPASGYDHSTVLPGTCSTCHNGSAATGKPARHITTSRQCDACHDKPATFFGVWTPSKWNHTAPESSAPCATCHNGSAATGKPAGHILTSASCETCHRSPVIGNPSPSWLPAGYTHAPTDTNCSGCHNGTIATGKTANHISVGTQQCSVCHSQQAWKPTTFDHASLIPAAAGRCTDCHNGRSATGKTANHLSTTGYPQCDSCHSTVAWRPTQFAHTNVTSASTCTTCHDGTHATGRPTTGVNAHRTTPMTVNTCGSCHTIGTSWTPATMNHSGATSCATCHVISAAGNGWTPGKTNHISTAGHAQCSDCHTTSVWKPSTFSHQGVTSASNCTTCHNGTTATGRPISGAKAHTIVPMTNPTCANCHAIGTSWIPASMNHSGALSCSTCHAYSGNVWTPVKANHFSTNTQCSSCHTTTAWLPATFNHATSGVTAATSCTQAGCHDVSGAAVPRAGRPTTHATIPMTSNTCANCHTSYTSWATWTMNHANATSCSSCHSKSGNSWTPIKVATLPFTHTATTSECSNCHTTVTFTTATFTHDTVTSATDCTSSNCHTPPGKAAPRSGIPNSGAKQHKLSMISNNCGSCHTIGTVWSPATMNHSSTAGQCTTCHIISSAGNGFTPAKANHIPTSGTGYSYTQCEGCHTTTAWKPANFPHTGVTSATNCTTCHNGTNATGRPTTGAKAHTVAPMSTSTACGTCHQIGTAWTITPPMNHSGLTSCTSCHVTAGNVWTVPGKANHISTAGYAQCSGCHATTAWLPTSFAHANVTSATNCTTCHNGTNATGRPTTGAKAHTVSPMSTSTTCGSCHTIGVAWTITPPMNHSGLTSCSSCHAYTGDNWTPIKLNHISTTSPCSSCHATTAWLPANFSHQGVTAATDCTQSGCHNIPAGINGKQLGRPGNHTTAPMTSNSCGSCHTIGGGSTASWNMPPWTMNHSGASSCSSCHTKDGSGPWTPVTKNSGGGWIHIPTTSECSSCHTTTKFFPASGTHNGVTTGTSCITSGCHSTPGQAVPRAGFPISGTKAHTVSPMNGSTCGSCHSIGTVWTVTPPMNHSGLTSCTSCHVTAGNVWTVPGKANHISTTGYTQCSSCHTTAAWLPTSFTHTGVTTATDCSTCHNGTSATGRPTTGTKLHTVSPMTINTCGSCHTIGTAWTPATMNHAAGSTTSCTSCHTYSGNGFTPAKVNHVNTAAQCSSCHVGFTTWAGGIFNHTANGIGSATDCTQSGCHVSGNFASPLGKPANHTVVPMTNNTCANCHTIGGTIASWNMPPWTMNHSGATSCSSCHTKTGSGPWTPITKNTGGGWIHITTSSECSVCHTTTHFTPATGTHTGVSTATNCTQSGCHSVPGQTSSPQGKPANHTTLPMTNTTCGSCHTIGTSWTPWSMNHTGAISCSSCHVTAGNTWTVPGKVNHISTVGYTQCSSCHTTAAWLPTSFTHSGVTSASNCTTCHNGTSATGRPTSGAKAHTVAPMTGNTCGSCHTIGTAWTPATMNHTGLVTCTSCHGAMAAAGTANGFTPAKANHIPVSSYTQCSTCHTTTLWAPSTFTHQSVTSATVCTTCHNGLAASGSPTGLLAHTYPPMNSTTCGSCHASFSTWVTTTMPHGATTTTCSNCHAYTGNGFTPAKSNHLVYSTSTYPQCSSCHATTAWLPATFNHTGIASTSDCFTNCHNGLAATGRPTTGAKAHTFAPMTGNTCGSCHTIGTSFTPATMNHTGLTTCSTCHNGTAWTGKTNTAIHNGTSAECGTCHSTTAWLPTLFTHTTAQMGGHVCSYCHDGVSATAKTAAHPAARIPNPLNCDSCHRTTAWSPATFAHTGITTGCTDCHSGGFATTKSATHFVTTQTCDKCHTTTAWSPTKAYVHTSPYYKAHSGSPTCAMCHINNTETITGAPHRGNAAYKPDCAWCHAQQYSSGPHKKTTSPTTVYYTVAELKNCNGACHQYTNNTFTTIQTSRTGHHHSTDGGFG